MLAAGELVGDASGDAAAVLARFTAEVLPRLRALPAQAIHNDANEHNVLVGEDGAVCGLIDFGDLCRAPRACGLAVACAYAMSTLPVPERQVVPLVAGYHEVAPLAPEELALLPDLIRTRLAMSIAMAARQRREQPGNDYLLISQQAVPALLRRLGPAPAELEHLRLRAACGYEAVPHARAVRGFLQTAEPGPVCAPPLDGAPVLDWSAGTPGAGATPAATPALGRYLEDRDVYDSDAFAGELPGERRTLHLGVDVFLDAGEPILAPLDGVVRDSAFRPAARDFGGVVLLDHRTPDGIAFHTLYGHLTAELPRARRAASRAAGVIGHIGAEHENGGWAPHLHLQLLSTDLGAGCAVHGVGTLAERDLWESVSPDPNLLLGLPAGVRAEPSRTSADVLAARRSSLSRALSISYAEPLRIVRGAGAHLYDEHGERLPRPRQQRLPRRPRAPARGARRRRADGAPEHEHALPARPARHLRAAAGRHAARPAERRLPRQLGQRGERPRAAARPRAHGRARRAGARPRLPRQPVVADRDLALQVRRPGRERPPRARARLRAAAQRRGRRTTCAATPSGIAPAAFIAESLPGVAGQIVLPAGYLEAAYAHARAAGAVCIADEVQVGFGRVGSAFWGFELGGVVPDVVTLGKPIGNGHPIGAVVTTPEIARSFETGMEYFNTFGGNPVSCAAALAVLDVIADERLQARAARLGGRMIERLRELARAAPADRRRARRRAVHRRRADVRRGGRRGRRARAPGAGAAVDDGPRRNVLKVKPPMVLGDADADRFLEVLDAALG